MALIADTRFLLTFFFPPNENVAKALQKFMLKAVRELVIPSIVVVEFIKIGGKRIGYERSKIKIRMLESKGSRIEPFTPEDAYIAGKMLLENPDIPFADACIASIAKRLKGKVVSDDQHFRRLGIRTFWPIKGS